MGSRKDIIKRSLGITEYPWSSDDELEAATQAVEETSLRRRAAEPLPNAADASSSGLPPPRSLQHHQQDQQQQSTSWNVRPRLDPDMFWSIISSPYRSPNSQPSGSQATTPRVPHAPASTSVRSADVKRILEFKQLTRNVGVLRGRSYLNGTRTTRVTPGMIVPEATSGFSVNRHQSARPRARVMPVTSPLSRNRPLVHSAGRAPSPVSMRRWDGRDSSQARAAAVAEPQHASPSPVRVQSDEDELNNNSGPPAAHTGQRQLTLDDANEEPDASLEEVEVVEVGSNSNVSLNEEVVPVDLDTSDVSTQIPTCKEEGGRASTSALAAASQATDSRLRRPAGDAAAVASGGGSGDAAPTIHGVKRKRRPSDDSPDLGSVKDFNQSLLRLLECPVCLEWMEPPMSQCRRGHLVCGRCRARLVSCPVCRTAFSSVRNRAMEGVAELLRYPCRHGCGRDLSLRRRAPHEASCAARKYHCPAPLCAGTAALPRDALATHFQCQHLTMMKIGRRHKFSMKVNSEQHDNWLILAMEEYFHLKIDVDIRTWGVVVYVSYIGPKCDARKYTYEVTIDGQHNHRKLMYVRTTHSDLESSSLNVSRQDCFHLTLDQALNFIRFSDRHCDADRFLDFNLEISKVEPPAAPLDESDS